MDTELPDTELKNRATRLGAVLAASGRTVATAESCTGGWIAKVLTDVAGASGWFGTGLVSYSNEAKTALLGVDPDLIARYGAVSEPVVRAMASGCRVRTGADLAVAVSGVAGPDGGTPEKPVGTVWLAIAAAGAVAAQVRVFPGDRDGVRRRTVALALDWLREIADDPAVAGRSSGP